MRLNDGGVLEVNPHRVQVVAQGLRARHLVVAAQRRVVGRVDVSGAVLSISADLELFASAWGSALRALGGELDLLGAELARSADGVVEVDQAGAR